MQTSRQTHTGLDILLRTSFEMPLLPAAGQFYFLRHGQTDGNRYKFFQPPTQPLNERGWQQAREAAALLRTISLTRIVASDMLRTLQTAQAVAENVGLPVLPSELLRERNFGNLVGSSSLCIDWTCDPADGETLEAFVLRVRSGLAGALAADDALVVAHGGTLYVLASMLGLELEDDHLANARPLRFVRDQQRWRIEPLRATDETEITLS